jgi:hypothetical protein
VLPPLELPPPPLDPLPLLDDVLLPMVPPELVLPPEPVLPLEPIPLEPMPLLDVVAPSSEPSTPLLPPDPSPVTLPPQPWPKGTRAADEKANTSTKPRRSMDRIVPALTESSSEDGDVTSATGATGGRP